MKNIQRDFPLLKRKYQGKHICYFDNAATAPKPEVVISAVDLFYTAHTSNVHRGPNFLEEEATGLYEQARSNVAGFINCEPEEIVFTSGATAAFNLVVRSWGEINLSSGDAVAILVAEHHANIVPWLQLKEKKGIEVIYIKIKKDGTIDEVSLKKALDHSQLKMLSLTLASNVLGQVYDLKDIFALAKKKGVITMADASQLISHRPIDVKELGCDFLAFSGHKLFAPSGIGVLYGRKELLKTMPPFLSGGGMIADVRAQSFVPGEAPYKFEAGTPNIEGAIGLGAAINYIKSLGWKYIEKREAELVAYFMDNLVGVPFARLIGGNSARLPLFSLSLDGIHPHDVADMLGEKGIIVRAGHHCAQPLHDFLGVPASLRISLAFYNTEEEVDRFFAALSEIHKLFTE